MAGVFLALFCNAASFFCCKTPSIVLLMGVADLGAAGVTGCGLVSGAAAVSAGFAGVGAAGFTGDLTGTPFMLGVEAVLDGASMTGLGGCSVAFVCCSTGFAGSAAFTGSAGFCAVGFAGVGAEETLAV